MKKMNVTLTPAAKHLFDVELGSDDGMGSGGRNVENPLNVSLKQGAQITKLDKNAKKRKTQAPSLPADEEHTDHGEDAPDKTDGVDPKPEDGDFESSPNAPLRQGAKTSKQNKDTKKKKARAPPPPADEEHTDHGEDGPDETDGVGKKPGRLSKAIISQAYALRQKYHDDLQHLATKEGKTVTSLLLAVGDTLPDGRALNTWNAFQAYATHPEGLKMECQEGQSPTEFQESIRAAYRKKRDGAEDVEEAFADVVEWYMERLSAQTANSRMKGLSEKKLKDIAKPTPPVPELGPGPPARGACAEGPGPHPAPLPASAFVFAASSSPNPPKPLARSGPAGRERGSHEKTCSCSQQPLRAPSLHARLRRTRGTRNPAATAAGY